MIARGSTRLTEPVMQLAFAAGELVEDLVALDLADALQDDLLGGLGADAAEVVAVELLGLDELAGLGVLLDLAGLIEGELGQRVLDLGRGVAGPEDADRTGLRVDLDVDVLFARDAAVCSLDALLQGRIRTSRGTCFSAFSWRSAPTKSRLTSAPPTMTDDGAPLTRRNVGWSPTSRSGRVDWLEVYTGIDARPIAAGARNGGACIPVRDAGRCIPRSQPALALRARSPGADRRARSPGGRPPDGSTS